MNLKTAKQIKRGDWVFCLGSNKIGQVDSILVDDDDKIYFNVQTGKMSKTISWYQHTVLQLIKNDPIAIKLGQAATGNKCC